MKRMMKKGVTTGGESMKQRYVEVKEKLDYNKLMRDNKKSCREKNENINAG